MALSTAAQAIKSRSTNLGRVNVGSGGYVGDTIASRYLKSTQSAALSKVLGRGANVMRFKDLRRAAQKVGIKVTPASTVKSLQRALSKAGYLSQGLATGATQIIKVEQEANKISQASKITEGQSIREQSEFQELREYPYGRQFQKGKISEITQPKKTEQPSLSSDIAFDVRNKQASLNIQQTQTKTQTPLDLPLDIPKQETTMQPEVATGIRQQTETKAIQQTQSKGPFGEVIIVEPKAKRLPEQVAEEFKEFFIAPVRGIQKYAVATVKVGEELAELKIQKDKEQKLFLEQNLPSTNFITGEIKDRTKEIKNLLATEQRVRGNIKNIGKELISDSDVLSAGGAVAFLSAPSVIQNIGSLFITGSLTKDVIDNPNPKSIGNILAFGTFVGVGAASNKISSGVKNSIVNVKQGKNRYIFIETPKGSRGRGIKFTSNKGKSTGIVFIPKGETITVPKTGGYLSLKNSFKSNTQELNQFIPKIVFTQKTKPSSKDLFFSALKFQGSKALVTASDIGLVPIAAGVAASVGVPVFFGGVKKASKRKLSKAEMRRRGAGLPTKREKNQFKFELQSKEARGFFVEGRGTKGKGKAGVEIETIRNIKDFPFERVAQAKTEVKIIETKKEPVSKKQLEGFTFIKSKRKVKPFKLVKESGLAESKTIAEVGNIKSDKSRFKLIEVKNEKLTELGFKKGIASQRRDIETQLFLKSQREIGRKDVILGELFTGNKPNNDKILNQFFELKPSKRLKEFGQFEVIPKKKRIETTNKRLENIKEKQASETLNLLEGGKGVKSSKLLKQFGKTQKQDLELILKQQPKTKLDKEISLVVVPKDKGKNIPLPEKKLTFIGKPTTKTEPIIKKEKGKRKEPPLLRNQLQRKGGFRKGQFERLSALAGRKARNFILIEPPQQQPNVNLPVILSQRGLENINIVQNPANIRQRLPNILKGDISAGQRGISNIGSRGISKPINLIKPISSTSNTPIIGVVPILNIDATQDIRQTADVTQDILSNQVTQQNIITKTQGMGIEDNTITGGGSTTTNNPLTGRPNKPPRTPKKTRTPRIPKPPKPKPPKKPPTKKPPTDKDSKDNMLAKPPKGKVKGYYAEIRKYKQRGFKRINKRPITKPEATNLALRAVDAFVQRSGKVTPSNSFVKKQNTKISQNLLKKFRKSKTNPNIFVEKSTFAIDSRAEKLGIPYKAQRLRRRKK